MKHSLEVSFASILDKFKDGTYNMLGGSGTGYGYKYIGPKEWQATDGSIVKKDIVTIVCDYLLDGLQLQDAIEELADLGTSWFCRMYCRKVNENFDQADFEEEELKGNL